MSSPTNAPKAVAIAAVVRESIRVGEYRPGHQLPSARVLADRYRAARGTVNAAMTALIREGLVVSRPRAGWFVAEPVQHQDVPRVLLTPDQRARAHVIERVAVRPATPEDAAMTGAAVGSPVLAVTRTEVDEDGRLTQQASDVIGADRALVYELPALSVGG